ncbi:hypothetical protein BESB_076660 [Besnoitia besnoiti]|uniref:Uncharacterized protein n=1 Tax=Besnoitia besnoiti TaxID=94643 RepID=A0A2A9M672_BESBE|nr:hypothetical protein BESB_076660 [Besnoitia besnoiti]PFH33449.1 hypothetical protein BESB_076660 [Besnoitia besnoiti]
MSSCTVFAVESALDALQSLADPDLRDYWETVLPSDTNCYTRCRQYVSEAAEAPPPPPGAFSGASPSASTRAWWSELRPRASVYTAGTFCKKGCDGLDAEDVASCHENCKVLCFKNDIIEAKDSWANISLLDRSPADPEASRMCEEACRFGCSVREELGVFSAGASSSHPLGPDPKAKDGGQS